MTANIAPIDFTILFAIIAFSPAFKSFVLKVCVI